MKRSTCHGRSALPVVIAGIASLLALVSGPLAALDTGGVITGGYIEARTSDIYTGPCFANAEVNLEGKEAVLAWRVDSGVWRGVDLGGRSIVAVLKGRATFGDPYADPRPRSLLLVDDHATDDQRQALVELARTLAPGLLDDVVAIETAPIEMAVGHHGAGSVRASAGDSAIAEVRTRGLHDSDHLCGNEEIYYPPLGQGADVHPGVTLEHSFLGSELGSNWKSPGKRSAFAGTFTMASPVER